MRKGTRLERRLFICLIGILSLLTNSSVTTKAKSSYQSIESIIDSDDYQVLTSGQTLTGLSIDPATDQDVLYIDGNIGQMITVAMERTSNDGALNGTLALADPTGMVLAQDDNSGGQGNPLLVEVELPTTGRYEIRIQDYSGKRTGSYQIKATITEPLIPAATHSVLDLEPDPCPLPMAEVMLPALPISSNKPQNANFSISNQALPRTSYPLNCEFARDRQVLATNIAPTSFLIQDANQTQTTAAFVVDDVAQYLLFEYLVGRKTSDRTTPLHVEVLSGSDFATITDLSKNTITGQYLDGWKLGKLPIMAFRGQTIKLRFVNDWWWVDQPSAHVRNLHLVVEVPDWQPSLIGTTAIEYSPIIGAHAAITGSQAFLVSAPLTIPVQAQSLSFNYQTGRRLNNGSASLLIQVLSGPDFATITNLDNNQINGRLSEGWKQAKLNIQAFQGQAVKLKVLNDWWPNEPQTSLIDSFKLNRAVPGWDISDPHFVTINTLQLPLSEPSISLPNPDFELGFTALANSIPNAAFDAPSATLQTLTIPTIMLNGRNAITVTPALFVPEQTTSIQFEYLIGDSNHSALVKPVGVAILSGASFDIREFPVDNQLLGSTQASTQTAMIDVKRYQGKTIKMQFINHDWDQPSSQFSNFRLVDHVPQWTASSQPRLKLITEASEHPSHGYLSGVRSTLVSASFRLPSQAQQVRLNYQLGDLGNADAFRAAELAILSGPDFGIRTRIDQNRLGGSSNNGWQQLALDVQMFRGQVVKLEFRLLDFDQPYLRIDTLELGIAVAGWSGNSGGLITIEPTTAIFGQSLRMEGVLATVTSDPWTVLTDTESISFDYKTLWIGEPWTSQITVNVLSGADFEVITPIDANTIYGSLNDSNAGWKRASVDVAQFQGHTIKLQFKHQQFGRPVSWLDNLTINQGVAGNEDELDQAPDANFLELRTANQSALSTSFSVPTDTQWLRMEYQLGNINHGNSYESLIVEVLSGSNFSTVTTISQGIASRATAGWQIAKLPLSQFQGQTIKIRLATPQFSPGAVLRVDKLALLNPRIMLPNPMIANGTSYLNVPLTQLTGITTTATMTITSLVVYDEYIDLAGHIYYAHTTYPFALSGDLARSSLGEPGDVVAKLQDTNKTFDVLYFAIRQDSFGSSMNTMINGENISIYLKRKNTREVVFIDSPLNISIRSIFEFENLNMTLNNNDIWIDTLINPEITSLVEEDYDYTINNPEIDETGYEVTYSFKWNIYGATSCQFEKRVVFGVYARGENIYTGMAPFSSQIKVSSKWQKGLGNSATCDDIDCYCNDIALGQKNDPITVLFKPYAGGRGNGDALIDMTYWIESEIDDPKPDVTISAGFGFIGITAVSLSDYLYGISPNPNKEIFEPYEEDTWTIVAKQSFYNTYLYKKGQKYIVDMNIAYVKGLNAQKQAYIEWSVPIYSTNGINKFMERWILPLHIEYISG